MKIKFGAIITDGRNKIGGHVVSKNRAGNYMKTKSVPTNPNTSFQSEVRANVTQLSQQWRTLSDEQRSAWIAAVADFKKTDIFGDLKTPSGFNLFMRLNLNLLNAGASLISQPPADLTVTPLTSLSVSSIAAGGDKLLAFLPSPVPVGYALVVAASPSMSPGRSFSKTFVNKIVVAPAGTLLEVDMDVSYLAKYGEPVFGKRVFFSAFLVNLTSGLTSASLSASAIVTN